MTDARTYRMKALTDLWTGDADGKPDRLVTTGLLGSIRWWFEVVVRGLGGSACDPSVGEKPRKPTDPPKRCPDDHHHRCVVCELFGCTGWARKFRFDVLDASGNPQQGQIKASHTFQVRFTPLRPICDGEWALLDVTLRFVADYAALGGKTVYKPSDEAGRQERQHHRDYGLVSIENRPDNARTSLENLSAFVRDSRWRSVDHGPFAWASLDHFWCVPGRYLTRQNANRSTFNRVIGRPEPKRQSSQNDSWLAGRRAGHGHSPESKKVFSFRGPPARTFGFTNGSDSTIESIKASLREVWQGDGFDDNEVRDGMEILAEILNGARP